MQQTQTKHIHSGAVCILGSGLTPSEKALLRTAVYFDLFDYPLTLLEMSTLQFPSSDKPLNPAQILSLYENSPRLQSVLSFKDGFFSCREGAELIETRHNRYNLADRKYKRARRALRVIQWVPFIDGVYVCNNLANNNVRDEGDIDFLILSRPGRLYLVRLLVTASLSFFRLRRHGESVADRICLSFYIDSESLDFDKIKIADDDLYLAYWTALLMPVDSRNSYDGLHDTNNWIKRFVPAGAKRIAAERRRVEAGGLTRTFRSGLEEILRGSFGSICERSARYLQHAKMLHNHHSLADQPDTRVVISDRMLKFHENDRRLYYRNLFYRRVTELESQMSL